MARGKYCPSKAILTEKSLLAVELLEPVAPALYSNQATKLIIEIRHKEDLWH